MTRIIFSLFLTIFYTTEVTEFLLWKTLEEFLYHFTYFLERLFEDNSNLKLSTVFGGDMDWIYYLQQQKQHKFYIHNDGSYNVIIRHSDYILTQNNFVSIRKNNFYLYLIIFTNLRPIFFNK